ncbi:MAG: hypothetical protein ACRDMV_09410 [Streptosporangiales bacterium]
MVDSNFRSVHLQLDELVSTARHYVDAVAEQLEKDHWMWRAQQA